KYQNHSIPRNILAERHGQRALARTERIGLQELAQEHSLAPRVGELDADGIAPRHGGGPHAGGAQGTGEVGLKPNDARRLHAARWLELLQRDHGTWMHAPDLAP